MRCLSGVFSLDNYVFVAKVTVVDAGADLEWEFKEGEAGWGRSV